MAKLKRPIDTRIPEALERAFGRVKTRLDQVLQQAKASGIERTRNLAAISDPVMKRSAAKK